MGKSVQILTLFLLLAGTYASGDQITEATVCQILADPVAYNGKMVKVRGRVVTGFEFFDIQGQDCGQSINSLTLAYPDRPRIEPAPSFTLSRDSEFKRFERYLTEKVKAKGKSRSRFECDRYEVTATITGRLDGVERAGIIRDDSGKVIAVQGFGHANRYRARLVIQSVSEVVAKDISDTCGGPVDEDADNSGRVLSTATKPLQTSVCEVTRSPASFDGKIVRLRATVASGFEVFGIRDPSNGKCGLIWLTYAGGGPVASLSMGAKTPNVQRQPVKLKNDRELRQFQKLLGAEMYPRTRGSICVSCNRYEVTATLTGRLDYAGKDRGFGHMNAYETQLVLESVSDVSATDQASNYDPKEYSPTPIRFPTGYLRGRVVAPDGQPVPKAEVNITSTEDVPPYMHDFTEWTDEKGRFKVAVPPGTYLLAINLETPPSPAVPFAATYYPGTADVNAAKKLSVADRQNLGGLVIRIPGRLRERKVPVKVTWPDGKPVEDANVWLAEIRNPTAVVGGAVSHTAADGTFDLIGFEGIDYFLHADIYVKPRYVPHCAEVRTLKSGDTVPDRLVMVLTRIGEACRGE